MAKKQHALEAVTAMLNENGIKHKVQKNKAIQPEYTIYAEGWGNNRMILGVTRFSVYAPRECLPVRLFKNCPEGYRVLNYWHDLDIFRIKKHGSVADLKLTQAAFNKYAKRLTERSLNNRRHGQQFRRKEERYGGIRQTQLTPKQIVNRAADKFNGWTVPYCE